MFLALYRGLTSMAIYVPSLRDIQGHIQDVHHELDAGLYGLLRYEAERMNEP